LGSGTGSVGTVTVDGAGSTWTANNANLFVGVSGTGTLTISNGGAVSSATGYLGYNGDGTGTVTVTGAGSAWTNSGSLYVGDTGNGTLTISNGGTVSNTDGHVGNNGALRGTSGAVTVDGAGSTWTNSGNLTIGGYGPGMLTISNGGTVSAGGTVTIAALRFASTLNMGASAGSPATAPGTLNAALVRFGDGDCAINFNHTDTNYIFAPAINGLGTLNQIAGTTILTADSSGFNGATNVSGGRLVVNGSLSGSIATISSGGILGGNGTVSGIVANAGGIIAPGNSIGTLNVAGNVAQVAGSTYQVELTSTGLSDRINATGAATIANGAILNVVKLDAAPYVPGTHYTVLQADGGVTGTYTLTGNTALTAFISLVDHYDASDVYLDVAKTSFAGAGLTPNQIATGGGADSLSTGTALYDAILMLPTNAAARVAFDQLSGEVHASAKTVTIEDSRFVRDAALDRLRDAFDAVGAVRSPVMSYASADPVLAPANTDRFAIWSRGFGSWGQWNGDGNAATIKRDIGGFFIGGDGVVAETWRLGLIGGNSRSNFRVADRNSSGTSDNYHRGLYGGTQWGNLALRSGIAYTRHDIGTSRFVAFSGFADSLRGNYSAGTTQAFGEFGYRIRSGLTAPGNLAFEPFANLAYVNLSTGSFTETGRAAALTSRSSSTGVAFTTLGLRASTGFTITNGMTTTARGMLGWRHAFGDTTPVSIVALTGGSPFTIAGAPIAEDAAAVEAGLDLNLTSNMILGLAYGGQFGSGLTDQTVRGSFSIRF
jgi:outer membrane autotransporter protein